MAVEGLIVGRVPLLHPSGGHCLRQQYFLAMATGTHTLADIAQLRVPYSNELFTEDHLKSCTDPFVQFQAWFQVALDCEEIKEAPACCLSTSTRDGRPSSRMVLMKSYNKEGFSFFTNYESRKGKELTVNPYACLLFYWPPLHRQVRIEGRVERLPESVSEEYFSSRPHSSKISASVSQQSSEVASREVLDSLHAELMAMYQDEDSVVPRPRAWGGYRLIPSVFEFWQGQSNRLHDRILFSREREEGQWTLKRLAP